MAAGRFLFSVRLPETGSGSGCGSASETGQTEAAAATAQQRQAISRPYWTALCRVKVNRRYCGRAADCAALASKEFVCSSQRRNIGPERQVQLPTR